MARFSAAVASAFRLRNSVLAEVLLIAFVYGVGVLIVWRHFLRTRHGDVVRNPVCRVARNSRSPECGSAT
jgi:hypothetical protein